MQARTIATVFIALMAVAPAGGSCAAPGTEDDRQPPSGSERGGTLESRLQAALDLAREQADGVGVSVAVRVPGRLEWAGVSGTTDPRAEKPMAPDRLLGIASISKTFVAAVVLRLVEEGRLELDSPAADLLPEHARVTNGATVRQLLNHTSGIFDFVRHPDSLYGVGLQSVDQGARWTAESIVPALVGEPYFAPGEGWHYSSTNYVLLGLIVEGITGRSLAAEVRARLLEPYDLDETHVSLEEGEKLGSSIDHGWCDRDGDGNRDPMSDLPLPAVTPWAEGVMYSTARDLARWAELLYGGKVVGQPIMQEMLDFHRPTPGEDWLDGYGLGTATGDLGGIRWQGHGGKDCGISAVMAHFPERDAVLVVLCNEGGDAVQAVAYAVAATLLEELGQED